MTENDPVRVQGTNGAELTLSVPAPGTAAREWFDARVASGALVVLPSPAPAKPRTVKPPKPTEAPE